MNVKKSRVVPALLLAALTAAAAGLIVGDDLYSRCLALLLGAASYPLYRLQLDRGAYLIDKLTAAAGAAVLTLTAVCAGGDAVLGRLPRWPLNLAAMPVAAAGVFAVVYFALLSVLSRFGSYRLSDDKESRVPAAGLFFIVLLCTLVCQTPMLLTYFPGNISYDSLRQLEQINGVAPYGNHHPLVHTLLIKLCLGVGSLFTDDPTEQAAFYSVFQMLLVDCSAAYIVCVMRRRRVKPAALAAAAAFFCLYPTVICYSMTMWKDVPFGVCVAVYTAALWDFTSRRESPEKSKTRLAPVLLCVTALFGSLLRTNGIAVFVLLSVVLLIKQRKRAALRLPARLTAICSAAALVVLIGVYPLAGIKGGDVLEALGVPLTQVAYTVSAGADLDEEQAQLLDKIIPREKIAQDAYLDVIDYIKNDIRAVGGEQVIKDDPLGCLRLWLGLGIKNPGKYLYSYVKHVGGYFFPTERQPLYIAVSKNDMGYEQRSLPGTVRLEYAINTYLDVFDSGALKPLNTVGGLFWIFAPVCLIALVKRRRELSVYYLPTLFILFTLLLTTPASDEMRYMFSLVLSLPMLAVMPFV